MEEILTRMTTTISEFKKNPNLEVKKAGKAPFAVLTNNKPSFYVLSPEYYDELCEKLWELENTSTILSRVRDIDNAVLVDLDQL